MSKNKRPNRPKQATSSRAPYEARTAQQVDATINRAVFHLVVLEIVTGVWAEYLDEGYTPNSRDLPALVECTLDNLPAGVRPTPMSKPYARKVLTGIFTDLMTATTGLAA